MSQIHRSMQRTAPSALAGICAVAFAIAFNLPYFALAATFDYPQILRRPAEDVLAAFAAGGSPLIAVWYAFGLCATAFVPLSIALSVTPGRLARSPALSIGAAIAGALAGTTQAIGLFRWVFAVPALADAAASAETAARPAAAQAFSMLNAFGGVAIGEHLGQLLTALFVLMVAIMQGREGARVTPLIGLLTCALLTVGVGEGLAIAFGQPSEMFGLSAVAGFIGLTAWLIATGAVAAFSRNS